MTPTTLTVYCHEIEGGDILVSHLGQRVGANGTSSLLYYGHRWYVYSTRDRLICTLDGDDTVEVIRNVGDGEGTVEAEAAATPTPCPPHGLARIRGLYMVVT